MGSWRPHTARFRFYDFWLFDRIDKNDGWFVSRVKDEANFEIVEELRTWRGNSIPLDEESLQVVEDGLQRQEIDVRITLSFDRKRGSGAIVTRTFRLVGLRNEETRGYHLYLTNLGKYDYRAPDIAQLYRARWEVELLFKELKSRFGLDEINTTDAYIIEALIIMSAISLMMSRVIMDGLRSLEARQREDEAAADADKSASRLPRRRCSLAVERHAHLIQLYLMVDLGYEIPNLDELLLWASQNPNPHIERLRSQVESGEFAFDRH